MRGAAAAFVGTPHAGGFLEEDATFVVVALPWVISGTPETSASKTPRYHSPCIAPTSAYASRPFSILSMQGPCPGGSPRNVPAIATGCCIARRPKGWVCEHPQAATLCRDRGVRCDPPRALSANRDFRDSTKGYGVLWGDLAIYTWETVCRILSNIKD
jgi:hypothetical protein